MDDLSSRNSLRDYVLNNLRSILKQIYHESVNNELSPENRSYLCLTLLKSLDEALRHGLKQLHLGYWRPVKKILHQHTLDLVEKLPNYNGSEYNSLTKGRTWIALALKDDSFLSYMQCLAKEPFLNKYYEPWSILRYNDSCNSFLSVLSGLENIIFVFEIDYLNKPPSYCNFTPKNLINNDVKRLHLNVSKNSITTCSSTLTSPVDSGVHIQDSSSDTEQDKHYDIDYLNGNVPEAVVFRKRNKDPKRHVSFHEDIICKSPEKCRKLKWDSEKLRYSWAGEELDSTMLHDYDFRSQTATSTPFKSSSVLDICERSAPEGEETPPVVEDFKSIDRSQKSIIVKRFLQSIKKQSKIKQLSKKYSGYDSHFLKAKVNLRLVAELNEELEREMTDNKPQVTSEYCICLRPEIVQQIIVEDDEIIYKNYQLRDYILTLTNMNIYLMSRTLERKAIHLDSLKDIIIYPGSHQFFLREFTEKLHVLVSNNEDLTQELIGRLEWCMRRNAFELPNFSILTYGDLNFLRRKLIEKLAIDKTDSLFYYGSIHLERENYSIDVQTPSSKRGFLMYRDRRAGDSWIPGEFSLKNGILYLLSEGSSLPKLAINLSTMCHSCCKIQNSIRPHTFQVTLKNQSNEDSFSRARCQLSKPTKTESGKLFSEFRQKVSQILTLGSGNNDFCVMEFAAADELELADWLNVIIQVSCGESSQDASKDDIIDCSLLLTTNSLIVVNESFTPTYNIEVLSCARLVDVSAFKIGKTKRDLFVIIEFTCMEASSSSGDWILYVNSRKELHKLRQAMQRLWKSTIHFPLCHISEERLLKRFQKTHSKLTCNWIHFYK